MGSKSVIPAPESCSRCGGVVSETNRTVARDDRIFHSSCFIPHLDEVAKGILAAKAPPDVNAYSKSCAAEAAALPQQSKQEPGQRFDKGKARWDLVPARAVADVVEVYTRSCKENGGRYDERNWEKGMSYSRVYACLSRHLQSWWLREDVDPDDRLLHMAKVVWNGLALLEYARTHPEMDDRPQHKKEEKSDVK